MAENNRSERERKRNRAERLVRFFVKLFCGKWNGSGTERLSGGFDEDFFFDDLCGVWRVGWETEREVEREWINGGFCRVDQVCRDSGSGNRKWLRKRSLVRLRESSRTAERYPRILPT